MVIHYARLILLACLMTLPVLQAETLPAWRLLPAKHHQHLAGETALRTSPSGRRRAMTLIRRYQVEGKPVDVRLSIPNRLAWQRELIMITLEVIADEGFFSIEADIESPNGFELYASRVFREKINDRGRIRHLRRLHWYYFPQLAGSHLLALPSVRYNSGGRIKLRIRPPEVRLNIRRLPHYLPPMIPVGRIGISVHQHQQWLNPGELGFVDIRIQAPGIPVRHLPVLDGLLDSQQGLHFLPADVKRGQDADGSGINGWLNYQVPFKTHRSGWSADPEITLHWFDPDSGRIRTTRTRIPSVFGLAWYWRVLLILLVTAGMAWAGLKLRQRWQAWRRYRAHYAQAMTLLHRHDPDAWRQALRCIAHAEGWPANTGIMTWYRYYRQRYPADRDLRRAIEALARDRYAGQSATSVHVAPVLMAMLQRIRRNPFTCPSGDA